MINGDKKTSKKYRINILFLLALILATMYFVVRDNEIGPLLKVIGQVNIKYIFVAIFMMLLYVFFEAVNTHVIMKQLGQKVPLFQCVKYIFVNIYFCSITPSASGGQPFQIFYMQRDNINVSYSSLTVLVVAAIYKFVLLCYGVVMLLLRYSFVMQSIGGLKLLFIFGVLVNFILISANLMTVYHKKMVCTVMCWISSLFCKLKWIKDKEAFVQKTNLQIEEYVEGGQVIRQNPMLVLKLFLYTFIQLTVMFMVPYCIYKAFGMAQFGIVDIISIQVILTICVTSLPLPGAVGPSESSFLIMFKMVFGSALVLPAMLLSRGIGFYLLLMISGFVTLLMNMQKRNVARVDQQNNGNVN